MTDSDPDPTGPADPTTPPPVRPSAADGSTTGDQPAQGARSTTGDQPADDRAAGDSARPGSAATPVSAYASGWGPGAADEIPANPPRQTPPGPDAPPPGGRELPPGGYRPPGGYGPPPGGYPRGGYGPPPRGGYQVPPHAGYRPPPRQPGDPLTGSPDESFAGWFTRSWAFFRRSWLPASLIAAGALVVPGLALAVLITLIINRQQDLSRMANSGAAVTDAAESILVLYLVMLAPLLLLLFLQSSAQVAIMRLLARDAAGRPRDLAADIRYGLRRGWVLALWQLLEIPIIMVGFCACIVPGYYLQLAMSQVPAVVAFERGHALPRSFRLMHSDFWPSVGRMLITAMIVGAYSSMIGMLLEIPVLVTTPALFDPDAPMNGTFVHLAPALVAVLSVVMMVATAPAVVAQCAGALGTYTGLRAKESDAPTSAELLAAAE
ncbi:hypothetical protein AB0I55_28440 [Actinocatenispora sera]|uniref:hypothetical protein n=1 Tax=Actinocatenispora sera TaxID=390989 RepID=UPI0033F37073